MHHQVKGLIKNRISSVVSSPTPYIPSFYRRKFYGKFPTPSNNFEEFDGVNVTRPVYVKYPSGLLKSFTLRNCSNAIIKSVKELDFSLIHSHFGQMGSACVKLKNMRKVPLITSFYGYDAGINSGLEKSYIELFDNVDLLLVLSNHMKNSLIKLGAPSGKIEIHHLGVDVERFSPIDKYEKFPEFTYLYVGRLDSGKGIQDSIKAFSRVVKSHPNSRFVIIGSGHYEKDLRKLIYSLNVEDKVSILDNFNSSNPRGQILEYMQKSHVFLFTSIKIPGHEDGTPVVLMEAQACKVPCIVTSNYGIPEVVLDEKTGFVLDEGQIDEIANSMVNLQDNEGLREELGENARLHIIENYKMEKLNKRLSVYASELIER